MTDALVRAAMLGTGREPPPSDDLVPADALPEQRLFWLAGARAVLQRAGWKAPQCPAPAAAPAETLQLCSSRSAQVIGDLFAAGNTAVLFEAADLLVRARQLLRPELLPVALSMPDGALRAAFLPALGARAAWLARMRGDWAWAGGAAPEPPSPDETKRIWEEGTFPERLAMLQRLRAVEPDAAQVLIESAWKQEKAEHRAQLIQTLRIGLRQSDEPFLESALDDRSASVRAAAAPLLALLPGSALARRMAERAAPLVTAAPVGLVRKLVSSRPRLSVQPPAELDPAWERDGVPRKPPQGIGARAFWLSHTIALVPPSSWEARLSAPPGDLTAAAAATDEALDLLEGLAAAELLFREPRWAAALFDAWLELPARDDRSQRLVRSSVRALLPLLTPDEVSTRISRLIARSHEALPLSDALRALPSPWSDEVSRAVAGSEEAPVQLVADAIAPAAFEAFEASLSRRPSEPPYLQRMLDAARETLRIRRILHQEIHR